MLNNPINRWISYEMESKDAVGLYCFIWSNQNWRNGKVIACLDDVCLVEYTMPSHFSVIKRVQRFTTGTAVYDTISYKKIPNRFLAQMQANQVKLVGRPINTLRAYDTFNGDYFPTCEYPNAQAIVRAKQPKKNEDTEPILSSSVGPALGVEVVQHAGIGAGPDGELVQVGGFSHPVESPVVGASGGYI